MNRRWPAFILIPGLLLAVLVFDQRDDTERARRARPPRLGSIDGGTDGFADGGADGADVVHVCLV